MSLKAKRKMLIPTVVLLFIALVSWFLIIKINPLIHEINYWILIIITFFPFLLVFLASGEVYAIDKGSLKRINRFGKTTREIPIKKITDIYGFTPAKGVQISQQRIRVRQYGIISIEFDIILFRKKELEAIFTYICSENSNIKFHER